MTAKTAKTRNPERRSGKAWSKGHNSAEAKPHLSVEKVVSRESKYVPAGGPSITMPKTTWNLFTQMMVARWPNTHKVRTIDAYLAHYKGASKDDGIPVAISSDSEFKTHPERRDRRARDVARASSRRDGR